MIKEETLSCADSVFDLLQIINYNVLSRTKIQKSIFLNSVSSTLLFFLLVLKVTRSDASFG